VRFASLHTATRFCELRNQSKNLASWPSVCESHLQILDSKMSLYDSYMTLLHPDVIVIMKKVRFLTNSHHIYTMMTKELLYRN